MSKLGGLINGQDVAFDTHQAGDAQEVDWKMVHLEKRLHGNRGKARYPLVGEWRPSSTGMNDNDFHRVTNEVRRALKKNESLLKDLAVTVVDVMNRFSSGEATTQDARDAAKKLAGYFDLGEDFLRVVEEYANTKLTSFVSIHYSSAQSTLHEILLTEDEIVVQKPRRHNSLRRIKP